MTIEILQKEMIAALKNGDKFRKNTISTLIAQVKRVAIDKGHRDDIDDKLVAYVLLKAKKEQQDSIDTCPESRKDLLDEYKAQLKIINEFCPQLITDENEIRNIILQNCDTTNKGSTMKFLKENYANKIDMKVAAQVFNTLKK